MPMRIGSQLPVFEGATEWITGSAQEATTQTQGRPTLVHFWSISCELCKENLPRVAEWRDKYKDQGLRVIAIHMPRYPADVEVAPVREAVAKFNILEPCAVDNEHKLRDAFLNEQGFVPAYYLFDKEGRMKGFAAGENGLNLLAAALNRVMEAATKPNGA